MRFSVVLCVLIVCAVTGFSQEHAMVWYFGQHAGLDFNDGTPNVLHNSVMKAEAGCSSICNDQGELQFYTNGNMVWNKNHVVMMNGDSLHGSQRLNQNSVIVPKPGSLSIYYLFTVIDVDSMNLFQYSVIDMSLDNGLGELIQKNIPITTDIVEKISAVQHCNGQDFWVIVHENGPAFFAYLVTSSGLVADSVPSVVGTAPRSPIGYMKISPAANKLVLPINDENLLAEVYTFDNETGKISNPIKLWSQTDNTYCYGVEFSPNGNLLYISTGGLDYGLWQYDLSKQNESDLNGSASRIASGNNYAMQLAPNGRIYIASENRPWLNVISSPNVKGDACEYASKAVLLGNDSSKMGLPNFVTSWLYQPTFEVEGACLGEITLFEFLQPNVLDSIGWNFGDGNETTVFASDGYYTAHEYDQSGNYDVTAKGYHCGVEWQVTQSVEVIPLPESDLVADTVICPGCNLNLDAGSGFDSYLWDNGSTDQWITVFGPGEYSVEITKYGCVNTDYVTVTDVNPLLMAPDAFTPNGDGLNDFFKLISNIQIRNFTLWVADRGGTLVFVSTHIDHGWDGRFRGKSCPVQTYTWFAEFTYVGDMGVEIKEHQKGVVTLLR